MDATALNKRKRIMARSIQLGHCVCDPQKDCPCPIFKEKNICECAGEREEIIQGEIRLTEHVRAVGCASKVPKKYLQTVIKNLSGFKDERVLIGSESSDDAGVITIDGSNHASVMTVDVFAPSVDDPYTFGMIAAANSLSDIYAMGGKAETALSIVGFPIYSLPEEAMRAMLQGGADKLAEAEVAVIGGHSINDTEVKCGYAILGSIAKDHIIANSTAQIGDELILTKPIGGGIVLFGKQINKVSDCELNEVITSMTTLNKLAGKAMKQFNANAATDVTGFSLLGHLAEIATGSKKEIELNFSSVPLFSAVETLAKLDAFPGAVERNREASEEYIDYGELTETEQNILFSPETSGGLLVALPAANAGAYLEFLADSGITAYKVGRVIANSATGIIRLIGSKGLSKTPRPATTASSKTINNTDCCCSTSNSAQSKSTCCSSSAPTDATDSCCTGATESSCCPESQLPAESSCCSASSPAQTSSLPPAAADSNFADYMQAVNNAGNIDAKSKKLIALALSVSHKCAECVLQHSQAANSLGASQDEIAEAIALGISFGGASANMFYTELRNKQ